MSKPTQDDCRKDFEKLLANFLTGIRYIDVNTPHSAREPQWWIKMLSLEREAIRIKKELKIDTD